MWTRYKIRIKNEWQNPQWVAEEKSYSNQRKIYSISHSSFLWHCLLPTSNKWQYCTDTCIQETTTYLFQEVSVVFLLLLQSHMIVYRKAAYAYSLFFIMFVINYSENRNSYLCSIHLILYIGPNIICIAIICSFIYLCFYKRFTEQQLWVR